MTITKIKYERQFPIGPYLQERIGFEAELGSVPLPTPVEGMFPVRNETPEEAIAQLRQLCENIHKEKYPHLYIDNQPITIEQVPDVQVGKPVVGDIFDQMASCTEIKVLESYKLMVKGFPDRQAAYDLKMDELKKDLE